MDNLQELLTWCAFWMANVQRDSPLYTRTRRSNWSMSVDHWHFGRCDLVSWSSTTRFPSPPLGCVLCALSTHIFLLLSCVSRYTTSFMSCFKRSWWLKVWRYILPVGTLYFLISLFSLGSLKTKNPKKGNPFFTCLRTWNVHRRSLQANRSSLTF